jgi:hypothetical protein
MLSVPSAVVGLNPNDKDSDIPDLLYNCAAKCRKKGGLHYVAAIYAILK